MKILTIDELRIHARADGEDDDLLELYGSAAEQDAEMAIDRAIFKDEADMLTQQSAIPTMLAAARAARNDAYQTAAATEDIDVAEDMTALANRRFQLAMEDAHRLINGIVVTDNLRVAMMSVATNSYINRSNVVSGAGAAAVEVPYTARMVYDRHRYMGVTTYG